MTIFYFVCKGNTFLLKMQGIFMKCSFLYDFLQKKSATFVKKLHLGWVTGNRSRVTRISVFGMT